MSRHVPFFLSTFSVAERPKGLSDFTWRLMLADERRSAARSQKLIVFLIATLVPLFSVLDFFAYPELFRSFFLLRIFCVAVTLGVFAVMITDFGKAYFRAFTVLLPLIPAFFISLMILLAQDPGTSYYAGLTLCIVAIGFVFHWTYGEAFVCAVAIAAMYFAASAPAIINGMDSRTAAGFINNCIFIGAKGFVIVIGCYAHHQFRIQNFITIQKSRTQQVALRRQKKEIEQTMADLAETESQLYQSEKMASLGQLSAGVIHEIGNPLNYSNQALFLLRRLVGEREKDDPVVEAIDDIGDSIDRMKEIVRELREFSHKSSEVKIEFPVRESVRVAVRMLGKEIYDSGVVLETKVCPDLRMEGVKNQITQVFVNLIHNAIQALGKKEFSAGESPRIEVTARSVGTKIEVAVRDNGPGISPEHLKQIFDPFFTTKEVGEGTGLGLSISFRIIESHGGTLRVDSRLGDFTEFVLSLPEPARSTGSHHLPEHQYPEVRPHETPVS